MSAIGAHTDAEKGIPDGSTQHETDPITMDCPSYA
jgi:hypothetical protein